MKRLVLIAAMATAAAMSFADSKTFGGLLTVRPDWAYTKTRGQSVNTETFDELLSWVHTTGTGANQMSVMVTDSATLTNGQSRTVSLLSIADGFGDTLTFAKVRFIAVTASTNNADAVQIGNGGPSAFAAMFGTTNDVVTVRPGGLFMAVAPDATGYAVGTSGDIQVLNTGTNSVSYVLYVGGNE
jgi:hypothetical protein